MRQRVLLMSSSASTNARLARMLRNTNLQLVQRDVTTPHPAIVLDAPDAIILDAAPNLPAALTACRMLHLALGVPVMVLLPLPQPTPEVMCFHAGAADVVHLQTADAVLIARLHALLGPRVSSSQRLVVGPLQLEREAFRLLCHDQPVPLRPIEFALLEALMARPRHTLERASLKRLAWDGYCSDHALDSAASRARKAVLAAGGPRVIVPVRGIGYRLGLDAA